MTSLQSAPPRHRFSAPPLRITMLGSRTADHDGLDAELGPRLVALGHTVSSVRPGSVSGSALAATRIAAGRRQDVVLAFGIEHAPLVPLLRGRGAAVALHVGGLEWKREGRSRWGRRALRTAERLAVRDADALITSGQGMADYYDDEFAVPADVIRPGTTVLRHVPSDAIEALGLVPGAFHLLTGSATEEHLEVALEGYHRSAAVLPLVVAQPHRSSRLAESVLTVAARDARIIRLGAITDTRTIEQLAAHAVSSVHGDPLGATPTTLLQAMGAGTPIVAWDTVFTREVAGTAGSYFSSPAGMAYEIEQVERYPFRFRDIGELMQERARTRHDWDAAAEASAALAAKLSRGWSTRGMSTGSRVDPAVVYPDLTADLRPR
ncbi:glycosyltransferase [uncultured Amnibacterium sp.]|uniref:glycosyltransferase n=1 Tax=uncultured Amnibacterium sp. TaxID=1631851 RepID=UPI0035CB094C